MFRWRKSETTNKSRLMRRILLIVTLFLVVTLQSCRCADPPPVGPVDDEEQVNPG